MRPGLQKSTIGDALKDDGRINPALAGEQKTKNKNKEQQTLKHLSIKTANCHCRLKTVTAN
jgi:hypothetical protein